ncbi:hypothetical protein D9M71_411180 [compost metagenome]
MSTILTIWDENVESDCSIDCSSPISANNCSNTASSEPSNAGTGNPACAINVHRPTVFKVTVLPPVLGPVMTIAVMSLPNSISLGIADSIGSSG